MLVATVLTAVVAVVQELLARRERSSLKLNTGGRNFSTHVRWNQVASMQIDRSLEH